jgi:hypothetical protein
MKHRVCVLAGLFVITFLPSVPVSAADDDDKKDDKKKEDEEEEVAEIGSKDEANFSIDKLVGGKEVWAQTADQVEKDYKKGGFKWLESGKKDRGILRPKWMWMKSENKSSSGRISFNISGAKTSYKLFDGASSAEEVNFDFRDGKLSGLTMSIWNKGDSDEISKSVFESKVKTLTEQLNGRLAVRVRDLGKDQNSASKAMRLRWDGTESVAQLEYSTTEELVNNGVKRQRVFVPEFIRLRLLPKGVVTVGSTNAANTAKVSASALITRVKKLPGGDIYIEGLPMVDQGDKGYCAVGPANSRMPCTSCRGNSRSACGTS